MSEKINPKIELSLIERSEAFANPQLLNIIFLSLYLTYQPKGRRMFQDIVSVREPFEPKRIEDFGEAFYVGNKASFSCHQGFDIYKIANSYTEEFEIPMIFTSLLNHIIRHTRKYLLNNPDTNALQIHNGLKDFLLLIDVSKSNPLIIEYLDVPLSLLINHFYQCIQTIELENKSKYFSGFSKYARFMNNFSKNIEGYDVLKKTLSKYSNLSNTSYTCTEIFDNSTYPARFELIAKRLDEYIKNTNFKKKKRSSKNGW
jgi:hypothetical protein